MAKVTIRAAQFQYYIPTGETRTYRDGREEEVLSIRHAFRGDTVNVPRDEDIAAGEAAGAFVPDEVEQESPVAEEEEAGALDFSSHDALVGWIKQERPTVAEVVAAAEDDPDKAAMLLAAEEEATGGQPRKGVVSGLEEISEEEE